MDTGLLIAVAGLGGTVLGWFVNSVLQHRRDLDLQRRTARLHHTERQLEELYGPLRVLLLESRRSHEELLDALDAEEMPSPEDMSESQRETWEFWAGQSFLPRNVKIRNLIESKTHLIEGRDLPQSHVAFLDHHNAWVTSLERWKKEGRVYKGVSRHRWPVSFEDEVRAVFEALMERRSELLALTQAKNPGLLR